MKIPSKMVNRKTPLLPSIVGTTYLMSFLVRSLKDIPPDSSDPLLNLRDGEPRRPGKGDVRLLPFQPPTQFVP